MKIINKDTLPILCDKYLTLRKQKASKRKVTFTQSAINLFAMFMENKFPNCTEISFDAIKDDWKATCAQKWHGEYFTECFNEGKRFCLWLKTGVLYSVLPRPPVEPWENRLHSSMANIIKEFVRRKREAGFPYLMLNTFLHFDSMLVNEFPNAKFITKEIALRWIEVWTKKDISVNTIIRNTTPIRQLSKFIKAYIDPNCYVIPSKILGKEIRYVGHMITEAELIAFFKKADALEYLSSCPYRHLTLPVVFRLLYSSGLRVSEIKNLKRDDIDLKSGKITIRESKSHALRIIIVHQQMLEVLQDYDCEIEKSLPNREWFFISDKDGSKLNRSKVGTWFRLIWDNMDCDEKNKGPVATARDFRHLYAFSIINKWYQNGLNLEALEPYLVCYMGHNNFEMTSYYINLSKLYHPDYQKVALELDEDIFSAKQLIEDNEDEVPYDN